MFARIHRHVDCRFGGDPGLEKDLSRRAGYDEPHILPDPFVFRVFCDQTVNKTLVPEVFKEQVGDRCPFGCIAFPEIVQQHIQSQIVVLPGCRQICRCGKDLLRDPACFFHKITVSVSIFLSIP